LKNLQRVVLTMTRKSKTKMTKTENKLNKINETERNRLGRNAIVNTRNFKGRQSFGAASEVRHISLEDYLNEVSTQ
jgi:hypothetical protein